MADDKLARIAAVKDTLTNNEAERLKGFEQKLDIALNRVFGRNLAPFLIESLKAELVLLPEFIGGALTGNSIEIPQDIEGWCQIAKEMVDADDMAKACIAFNNHEEKDAIKSGILQGLAMEKRLAMARSGELDSFLDGEVEETLRRRAGLI